MVSSGQFSNQTPPTPWDGSQPWAWLERVVERDLGDRPGHDVPGLFAVTAFQDRIVLCEDFPFFHQLEESPNLARFEPVHGREGLLGEVNLSLAESIFHEVILLFELLLAAVDDSPHPPCRIDNGFRHVLSGRKPRLYNSI